MQYVAIRLAFQGIIVALLPAFIPLKKCTIMAKLPNPLKAEEIQLSVNVQTVWYLDRLIETGLYGNSRAEAAKVVLYDHCKLLITEGKLTLAPLIPGNATLLS